MANLVVVGMQWGDEGKGKVVDLLCPAFDAVVRYQGGHNAGHTVKFADRHFSLHLIPSGILHEGVQCFLGQGMVINPEAFFAELEKLHAAGVVSAGRLFISDRAHVLLPVHAVLDQLREVAAGALGIGTTGRGIGPAYEHKASRFGVRIGDLTSTTATSSLEQRIRAQVERARWEVEALSHGGAASASLAEIANSDGLDAETIIAKAREFGARLRPYVRDVSFQLDQLMTDGGSVLFEGAQGAGLDLDAGTYPYVTSSSSCAGGAATGSGVAPTRLDGVIGILKAYTTRVGAGPFPCELQGEVLDHLRQRGHEFGTTTGRPRRCGWLDLVLARYARRTSGIGAIALTKLDVLDSFSELQVCTAYRIDGEIVTELPAGVAELERAEPIYRKFAGWQRETVGTLREDQLPREAREYIAFIEQEVGAPVSLTSTGPRREETILSLRGPLPGWLGEREAVVRRGLVGS